jgi:hypothetical protein
MPYRPGSVMLEAQHPREELDHALPFSRWLADGETIVGHTLHVQAGLTLTPAGRPAPTVVDGDLVFWLGGGASGTTYEGEAQATTSEGRKFIVSFLIEIHDPTPLVPE